MLYQGQWKMLLLELINYLISLHFFILLGEKNLKKKFQKIINKKPYNEILNRYKFVSYDSIINSSFGFCKYLHIN